MTDFFVRRTAASLAAPEPDLLREIAGAAPTDAEHARLAAAAGGFDVLETGGAAAAKALDGTFRVAAWNGERLKFPDESAALVREAGADVLFLTEADVGMARSGNRHTAADLADALGMGYAFGVEFLELSLGDERESVALGGQANRLGFHGNALLARSPIREPFALRLDDGAVWWRETTRGQKRLGWRMAVGGWIEFGDSQVLLASVHLESKTDPADRARQAERLIGALSEIAGDAPIVMGGDFNTKTVRPDGESDGWFRRPDEGEPLFRHLRDAGFGWEEGNAPETTQRPSRTSEPAVQYARLDWLFSRRLRAAAPLTVPALDPNGEALSDHDLVVAEFGPT